MDKEKTAGIIWTIIGIGTFVGLFAAIAKTKSEE